MLGGSLIKLAVMEKFGQHTPARFFRKLGVSRPGVRRLQKIANVRREPAVCGRLGTARIRFLLPPHVLEISFQGFDEGEKGLSRINAIDHVEQVSRVHGKPPNGRAFSGEPSEQSERPERMRGRRVRCNAMLCGTESVRDVPECLQRHFSRPLLGLCDLISFPL
jgi:hypothetical protein